VVDHAAKYVFEGVGSADPPSQRRAFALAAEGLAEGGCSDGCAPRDRASPDRLWQAEREQGTASDAPLQAATEYFDHAIVELLEVLGAVGVQRRHQRAAGHSRNDADAWEDAAVMEGAEASEVECECARPTARECQPHIAD